MTTGGGVGIHIDHLNLFWKWVADTYQPEDTFTTPDLDRQIYYLVQIGDNPRGTITSLRRISWTNADNTQNNGQQGETWLRDIIAYSDQGTVWQFTDSNDDNSSQDHPSTGVYTEVPYHTATWFNGVQIIQELLVTWNLRFYDGSNDYPFRPNNDLYPAYVAVQEQLENPQVGRTWGWDGYKTFPNGISYSIQGVYLPENISPQEFPLFSTGFDQIKSGLLFNPPTLETYRYQTDLTQSTQQKQFRLYMLIYGKKNNE